MLTKKINTMKMSLPCLKVSIHNFRQQWLHNACKDQPNPSITIQTLHKTSYLLGTKKVVKYTFSNICRDKVVRKLQEMKYWFHKHLQQISALTHHQTF